MDSHKRICKSCGQLVVAGPVCPVCTLTDLRLASQGKVLSSQSRAYLADEGDGAEEPIFGNRWKIGRDPTNNLVIDEDLYSSRVHAWIVCEEGDYFVEDLGSRNGTWHNGTPLNKRQKLVNGDQLKFGRSKFIFHLDNVLKI
jgi:pSer/pThr/pTyr-binding forkhead associated (FHA) protein